MCQKARAWIELDLRNLAYNLEQFKKIISPGCEIMPAVKANAYGHGAVLIGQALQRMGISHFCVASVKEGVELRKAGIQGQILVLGYTSPCQFEELLHYDLTQTVVDFAYAKELQQYGQPVCVHVGIDTGMHRLGERSEQREKICKMWEFHNLKITGVFSHLCVSDGISNVEKEFTYQQIKKFDNIISYLRGRGISGFKTHLQGSYGILNYPHLKYDFVRPGIALYGVFSSLHDEVVADVTLKPVLSLKARVECVKQLHMGETAGYGQDYFAAKEMKIAAVSIGYADGLPRELSNKGYALLNGYKAPIIGRICMDQLLLDVSGIPYVSPGDESVFIGKSSGSEILVSEMADTANTISNEVLSRLGSRLERVVLRE